MKDKMGLLALILYITAVLSIMAIGFWQIYRVLIEVGG